MLDTVALYAQAGFCVFELDGKTPINKEWQHTPHDPNADRAKHPGNFGVVIGQDYLVIDIDVKNGQPGLASFVKLTEDAGLPKRWEADTFVVQTGTGGFHVYLKKPKNFNVKKNPPAYPGIDFLAGNHYVVGAGSIHPDTRQEYRAVVRSPNDVCPAPATILNLIEKTEQVDLQMQPPVVDDDPINIERFIEILASMPVVNKGNQRNSCYIAACKGRDLGLSIATCCATLHTHYNGVKLDPAITPEEVDDTAKNAYRYAKGQIGNKNVSGIFQTVEVGEAVDVKSLAYDRTEKGTVKPTLKNAVNYLTVLPGVKDTFRFNTFTERVEIGSACPWAAERGTKSERVKAFDYDLLRYHIANSVSVEFPEKAIESAVSIVGHRRHYHPVKNYLKTLVWDRVPRLDTWLIDYAGAVDNEYTRAIGRKTLCAAVKRIFHPGCKFDYMLILEGNQGIGKSQLVTALGRLWYGRMTLDPHHKDTLHKMKGKWIIEIAELNGVRWADANALKAFIDTQVDTARLSYEKDADDIFRQSIFIGTVNPEHVGYLADPTGNRRYWMVQTPGPIKLVDFENNLAQIYAEAMMYYENEQLWLTGEAHTIQIHEARQRMPDEPFRQSVTGWLNQNQNADEARVTEILEFIGVPAKNQNKGDISRIAQVFVEMGWSRERRETNGVPETVYVRPLKERIEKAMDAL